MRVCLRLLVSYRSHFQGPILSSSPLPCFSSLPLSSFSSLSPSSSFWPSLSPFFSASSSSSLRKSPQLISLSLYPSLYLSPCLLLLSSSSLSSPRFLFSSLLLSSMALPTSSFSPSLSREETSASPANENVRNAEKKQESLSPSTDNVREKEAEAEEEEEDLPVTEGTHQKRQKKMTVENGAEEKDQKSTTKGNHETDMRQGIAVVVEEEKTSSSSLLSSSGLDKEEEEDSLLSSSSPTPEEEEEDHSHLSLSSSSSSFSSSTSRKGVHVERKEERQHLQVLSQTKENARLASALVVAGPSGVGKGTLVKKLFQKWPSAFGFSVSHTSRAPRPGEVNGREYFFCSKEDFLSLQEKHYFLETAEFSGNLYGTSFSAVNEVMKTGRICVLEIDLSGVIQVQNSSLGSLTKFVFLQPPSLQELEQRLRGRDTEKEVHIKKRLETAEKELELAKKVRFDFCLVNDNIDDAWEKLKTQIETWYGSLLN